MSTRSKLQCLMLAATFATSATVLAAASPAWAHGSGYFPTRGSVNTIHPIAYHPTSVGTIRPTAPIVNTIHPIASGTILSVHAVPGHDLIPTVGSIALPVGPIVRDHRGGEGEGGVTITSIPRPPTSSSWCIVSCGAHLGTPTYYNAGTTIRDHRSDPYGWGN